MTKRMRVDKMITYYTRNSDCTQCVFLSVAIWQLALFHKVANHPSISASWNAILFCCPCLSFSVLTEGILNGLRLPRAGANSVPLPKSSVHTQSAPFSGLATFLLLIYKPRRHSMPDSNRSIYFLSPTDSSGSPSSASFEGNPQDNRVGGIRETQKLSFTVSGRGKAESISFPETRCSERGCVFPAASLRSRKCLYHMHQQQEPVLFCSHQPTGLLLDPARTTPTEQEYDGSRKRDRRRLAAIWEQFQSDGTP